MNLDSMDTELRRYAKRLDPDHGEDAYHEAVITCLRTPPSCVKNWLAFMRHCVKKALAHLYRDLDSERRQALNYLQDGPPLGSEGLRKGQLRGIPKREMCIRGLHALEGANVKYKGRDKHRTCRCCYNANALASYHRRKVLKQVAA